MRIDLHCHFTPKEYFDELRRRGVPGVGQAVGVPIPTWESTESRIQAMDEARIDVQVLSLSAQGVFFPDEDISVHLARITNDILGDIHNSAPTRLLGFANVPLPHVGAAIEELHRVVSKPWMAGVALGTNILGKRLDAEEFHPFFEEANRLGLAIFIHPAAPVGMPNAGEFYLGALVGYLFETVLTASRLALTGTLDRFPRISPIFAHLGGYIPFIYPRLDSAYPRHAIMRARTPTTPSDHFRRLYYDTASSYDRMPLACALDLVGPEHIVLGTDYPQVRSEMAATVAGIESASLSMESVENILSGNARRILRMPEVLQQAY